MNDLEEQKVKDDSGTVAKTNEPSMTSMMWMLVICCGLPLLLFVVLPLIGLKISGVNISWVALGLVAVAACIAMMVFSHRKM